MIICKVCGKNIESEANYCPNCGAVIEKIKAKDSEKLSDNKSTRKEKNSKSVNGKIKKSANDESKSKIISYTKLLYIILPLLIIAVVILISSGIFNSAATPPDTVTNIPDNPHAGADLNKLRQITEFE